MASIELPNSMDAVFLTDSGLETDLIFNHGFDLPEFAAYTLLKDAAGRKRMSSYYREHAEIAVENGAGFVFDTPTWRAQPDYGDKLGHSRDHLARALSDSVELVRGTRDEVFAGSGPSVISGQLGPRGDGYSPDTLLSADEAGEYHSWQIGQFKEAGVDMVSALTITHPGEAAGLVEAARDAGLPITISFTVETNGRLPDGNSIGDAIGAVDAATGGGPDYYMINCAHPDHFSEHLDSEWMSRVHGLRANASRLSHAELDEMEVLDDGNPQEFGSQYAELLDAFPHISVMGGCCGTDARHVAAIAGSCLK